MEQRYLCIHGHFYQPPREHAWLEVVEQQESAYPFHDWNERINYECYARNTASRILDDQQRITSIVNNYSRISFNFGPTLLSWMEQADPDTYQGILAADRESMVYNEGHGSAMAQVHSHLILPLCNRRDKETQVLWGVRDFEYRFQRKPEGMWLSETAVDTETLEVLAENGIIFTILAPRQAKAFRKKGSKDWDYLNNGGIDPRHPYLVNLPSGKTMNVFFYDGGVSQSVAFSGLLNNGKVFAHRLQEGFGHHNEPVLCHIATDGESYGHHHRFGEMALSDCLNYIEEKKLAKLCNYSYYLAKFPPTREALIHDNSSWSCVHGVERWRSDCGCNTGGHPHWNQSWRKPLREALDWLRDEAIIVYEKEASKLLTDPWNARDEFIEVILDRDFKHVVAFLDRNSKHPLNDEERTQALRLLELQRNAMLMFTSCAWFFDEVSGIETNQVLQYACRVIYYARQVADKNWEDQFITLLEKAKSNLPEYGTAAESYRKNVLPSRIDLDRVGMHYGVSSLFEAHPERLEMFNYIATSECFERKLAGNFIIAMGRTSVKSKITHSEKHFSFAVLYLGQQNIIGNISKSMSRADFDAMQPEMLIHFEQGDLGKVISIMQSSFGSESFSLDHLFRDEKSKVLNQLMDKNLQEVEASYRKIYRNNYQLMNALRQNQMPVPDAYKVTLKFLFNRRLKELFNSEKPLDLREMDQLGGEFKKWDVALSRSRLLNLTISERLFREVNSLEIDKNAEDRINSLNQIFEHLVQLGLEMDLWKIQNRFIAFLEENRVGLKSNLPLQQALKALGENLMINMGSRFRA
ncbi:MAG: DUF3536 domain-containing protein [Bacteroidota bacterium]